MRYLAPLVSSRRDSSGGAAYAGAPRHRRHEGLVEERTDAREASPVGKEGVVDRVGADHARVGLLLRVRQLIVEPRDDAEQLAAARGEPRTFEVDTEEVALPLLHDPERLERPSRGRQRPGRHDPGDRRCERAGGREHLDRRLRPRQGVRRDPGDVDGVAAERGGTGRGRARRFRRSPRRGSTWEGISLANTLGWSLGIDRRTEAASSPRALTATGVVPVKLTVVVLRK